MGTKTKEKTRATVSVNGGAAVDMDSPEGEAAIEGAVRDVLEGFGKEPATYLREADVPILRTAGEMAKKAGEAAAKACEKALLTEEASAALALAGYAEEALLFMDRRQHGFVEWTSGHKRAMTTGCHLFFEECKKIHEKQVTLDIGTSETDARQGDIRRVYTRVLKAPGAQLDAEDDTHEGEKAEASE